MGKYDDARGAITSIQYPNERIICQWYKSADFFLIASCILHLKLVVSPTLTILRSLQDWTNLFLCIVCLAGAAMAAGLTVAVVNLPLVLESVELQHLPSIQNLLNMDIAKFMRLRSYPNLVNLLDRRISSFSWQVSLEEVDLRVKLRTGSPEEQAAAEKLLPLVRQSSLIEILTLVSVRSAATTQHSLFICFFRQIKEECDSNCWAARVLRRRLRCRRITGCSLPCCCATPSSTKLVRVLHSF